MLTTDFDFNLPLELIAQTPAEPRDSSRLMVVNRTAQTIQHHHFFDIINFLEAGDLIVWNNSKVFKARLIGEIVVDEDVVVDSPSPLRSPSGPDAAGTGPLRDRGTQQTTGEMLPKTAVEIFLVRPMENPGVWKVLAKPGKKLRLGMKIKFADDFVCDVLVKEKDGTVLVQFADGDTIVREKANTYGEVPLPPYVSRKHESNKTKNQNHDDSERYQTVYAKHEGSVAAPTAGFHFTPELIEALNKKGVQFAEVTLHVGLGTFLPVKTDVIEEHQMHSELVELTDKNAQLINTAKAEGRRVVAVGTTTVRTLEGIYVALNSPASLRGSETTVAIPSISVGTTSGDSDVPAKGRVLGMTQELRAYTGDINIFITPGFTFNIVDALITNFHLPKSTLLMLVSSFMGQKMKVPDAGRQFVLECYTKAIENKYRFYSFGDAMLII